MWIYTSTPSYAFTAYCLIKLSTGTTLPFSGHIHVDDDESNNNSIKLLIIYVPSQQLQGQLQTYHSVDTVYTMEKHNTKSKGKLYASTGGKTHQYGNNN
jgi:ABC-type Mn2+/Zn2+ transport system ATPase subunit